jgi:hypothetical protein
MSKLMSVLGIILLAVGAALALVGFVNPAQMQVYGLTMDTGAILLTGGILAIGLGGVIGALQGAVPNVVASVDEIEVEAAAPAVDAAPTDTPEPVITRHEPAVVEEQPRVRFNPFGRKLGAAAATATVAAATTEAVAEPAKSAVDDTIAALEQAKADIANAIGGVSAMADDKPEAEIEDADEVVDEDDTADDDVAEGELYVLEERDIRGRPARILSDNTVEAETDEGWMRFENIEHLNEYLDSMGEPAE